MNRILKVGMALACLGWATQASATDITYTVTGSAVGTIGGRSYNGAFTLTSLADIANQHQCVSGGTPIVGCTYLVNKSVDLNIASLGHFTLTNPSISSLILPSNRVTFTAVVPPDNGLNAFASFLAQGIPLPSSNWDGISNLGPVATTLALFDQVAFPTIDTSGGPLAFARAFSSSSGTFSATLQAAAVPEAPTWTMMVTAFGLIGGTLRRQRKLAVAAVAPA